MGVIALCAYFMLISLRINSSTNKQKMQLFAIILKKHKIFYILHLYFKQIICYILNYKAQHYFYNLYRKVVTLGGILKSKLLFLVIIP